jgi:NADH oxidase (H2O2-forming)
MGKENVLVIGGSAAGIVTAVTGKSSYSEKNFLLIRKEKHVVLPCGIPYIFGSLKSSDKDIIADAVLTNAGVDLKIDEVVSIDQENKLCKTADGAEINFEKLVLATGSLPVVPKWLKGADLENVFTIPKNKVYLDEMMARLRHFQKIVTIGGGFIGVEVSDELNKAGKDVTIVEILPHMLGLILDEEIATRVEEILKSRGVDVKTGVGVKEILGDKEVAGVLLENGETIEADLVILAMGYRPNTGLAEKSGIKINELGFIKVDEYMRTNNPDIFAVGDCAEKRDFITRKLIGIMLASTACTEARVAGMNLYNLSALKTFGGTIAIFSTAIGETAFGAAGLTEKLACKEGFDIVTGTFEGFDKHPGTLPGTHRQLVKLIVERRSGVMLGGEVAGGPSAGELINLIGLAIQNRMTVDSILTTQIGTHPLLTASPAAYPFIKAAEVVAKKIKPVEKLL